jgi:hypothetical protein
MSASLFLDLDVVTLSPSHTPSSLLFSLQTACRRIGRRLSVLPYCPLDKNDGWLLKMHGCVTHAEAITLTRKDYIRYAGE